MAHVYALLTVFQINAIGLIITVGAGHVSHVRLSRKFCKCRPIIDAYKKQSSEVERLLFILIPHMYTFFFPEQLEIIHQGLQEHINIVARFFWPFYKHRHHDELTLQAQPSWKVEHT